MNITKAVIPVAGLGTRLLPATSAVSKCLFPVVDTPVIQYVVEEAVASGITDIAFVVGSNREAIQRYFTAGSDQISVTRRMQQMRDQCHFRFIVQQQQRGLGDAVACAEEFAGNEPFALLLGDSIMRCSQPVIGQLIDCVETGASCTIGVERVARERVNRYGIVAVEENTDRLLKVTDLVEKPSIEQAPSDLAIAGRYVLPALIFEALREIKPGVNGEIQLTDAIRWLLHQQAVFALRFEGERFDIGNKLDFVRTNLVFALDDPEITDRIDECISNIIRKNNS